MAQLIPLPLTVSCFSIIQINFIYLYLAWCSMHTGMPVKAFSGQLAIDFQANRMSDNKCHLLPPPLLHLFISLSSRTTWVSRYQNGKTSPDLNEARDEGFRDAVASAVDHMQTICTSHKRDNHTNTSSLNFLWARCSSWHPTASKHWRHKHCQQMPTNIRTSQSYLYFKQMQSSSRLGKMQALLITNKRESATSRSSLILYPPLPIMQPAWLWWTSRRILKSVDVCRTTVHSLNSEMTNDHTKHYNITRKPWLKVTLTTGARQTQNVLLLPINRT